MRAVGDDEQFVVDDAHGGEAERAEASEGELAIGFRIGRTAGSWRRAQIIAAVVHLPTLPLMMRRPPP